MSFLYSWMIWDGWTLAQMEVLFMKHQILTSWPKKVFGLPKPMLPRQYVPPHVPPFLRVKILRG
ncbi:UNVERIFIED_CONTAM: hypothetical protein GTU68_066236 [Idotea baltica]|nr:hypothetical protein [Idotea baltica]